MEGWCFTDSRLNFKAKEEAYKKGAPATLICLVLFLGVVVWILSYREQKLTQSNYYTVKQADWTTAEPSIPVHQTFRAVGAFDFSWGFVLKWQLCYFVTQCSKLSLVFCFQSFALCLPGVCYVYTECACEDRWQRPADQTLFVPVPMGRTKVTGTWTWRLLPSGTIHE